MNCCCTPLNELKAHAAASQTNMTTAAPPHHRSSAHTSKEGGEGTPTTPSTDARTLLCPQGEIPTLIFLPYFLGVRLMSALPSLRMMEYRVNYTNHPSYHASGRKSSRGSPVRIFTNINPAVFKLPLNEGYRLCTVSVFRQKFTLEDAFELHAFAPREALPCV
jgi:hypothetical protein